MRLTNVASLKNLLINRHILCLALLLGGLPMSGQILSEKEAYTKADTLRGSLRAERAYDVLSYHLRVRLDPEERYISGFNTIGFKAEEELPVIQVDLFENMKVDSILHQGKLLSYHREHDAVFIEFEDAIEKGALDSISFHYSGHPIVAKNAPWDGGFVFDKDQNGNHFIAVAVQGTGASLWYPNKDHQSDEPQEVLIEAAVPSDLMNVSNGRFVGKQDLGDGYTQWSWKVSYPINNYNIVLNIGNYEHFSDTYEDLDLDYYVLPYNLEKAKKQFEEVQHMMACFYEKFGEYPFVRDGFKLVEVPYLGMEHQSAVGYGNKYMNGYLGRDISGTGHGLKWDYIIIHESGHEWFGNSITSEDIADMWIHEGFTSYAEAVYVECRWGKKAGLEYVNGLRRGIRNERPIIGDYGVNTGGSGDMYSKGANLLNTLRGIYNDDELWWKTMKDYSQTYMHQIITTKHTEEFFDAAVDVDLRPVFDQYLRHASLPELEFKQENNKIFYKWNADVKDFQMPVDILIDGTEKRLYANSNWQELDGVTSTKGVRINEQEFYVETNLQ